MAASLTPLPLPGAFIGGSGAALDISQDGRVIVGWAETSGGQQDAFRWDLRSTGYQATNLRSQIEGSLPNTPINYTYGASEANAVAVSGTSVFIGGQFSSPFGPALGFRIGPGGTDYFGTSENYTRVVNALSRDGSVVAGTGQFPVFANGSFAGPSGFRAFANFSAQGDFWPLDGFFSPPGPGGLSARESFGNALSADGRWLAGNTYEVLPGFSLEQRIFVTDLNGTTGTRLLDRVTDAVIGGPGFFLDNNTARAEALSADGTRVVGSFQQVSNGLPLGVVYAKDPVSGDFEVERLLRPATPVNGATVERSEAVDISDDNRLIVGNGTASSPGGVSSDDLFSATLWDNSPASGVEPRGALLRNVLSGAGVDVSRWLGEFRAEGLSGNGRYVVGRGEFDLGGGTLQWLPWVADLEGTGFWNAPPPPPPPGFADTFFFVPDASGGNNRLGFADRWQDGLGNPAGLVPGAAQAAVFNSPDSYFIDLDGTVVGPGGVAGPDFSVDTLAVIDGQVTFFANSLPRPLIEATRQVTVDGSLSGQAEANFTRLDLRTPLLEVQSGDVSFFGGSLDAQEMQVAAGASSFWFGNEADVEQLELDGYLLVTEDFGTPETAANARFGEVAVNAGGWFNQVRNLVPGAPAAGQPAPPLTNSSTVIIDRTLDVAAGGRYELVEGRLEVGPGDPADPSRPAMRVAGVFSQFGGKVEVEGDAEVTGLFSAQGWDLVTSNPFVNPNAREAPVIDIDGTLTVAGNGQFVVSSNVPGGRVGLGALQVDSRGGLFGLNGFAAFGVRVDVAGDVAVGLDGAMGTSDLAAASINNAGTFSYDQVDLAGGDFINSGTVFSAGDPASPSPQTSINGRLENSGIVSMQNGLTNEVLGGVDSLGGVLYLGSQVGASTRLATPRLDNNGLLISFGGDNRIQGPASAGGPGPIGGLPTPTQVTNNGTIRVDGGRLGILGSLAQNGTLELLNGGQVQANSVFQASAASAQAAAAAEGMDADASPTEPTLLTAVAHATPIDAPTLEVSGDFTLGTEGVIDAVAGSILRIGGNFTSNVATPQDLSTLTLEFFGDDAHTLTATGDITFGGLDASGGGSVRILREAGSSGDLRIAFATTLTAALLGRLDAATGVGLLFAAIDPDLLTGGPLGLAGGGSIALLDSGGNPVPLPAAFWLLASGASGLLLSARRSHRSGT